MDRELKRQAMQIVTVLPEDRAEALQILDYARKLLDWEIATDVASAVVRLFPTLVS